MTEKSEKEDTKNGKKAYLFVWVLGWLFTMGIFFGSSSAGEVLTTSGTWDVIGFALFAAILLFFTWPVALGCFLSGVVGL